MYVGGTNKKMTETVLINEYNNMTDEGIIAKIKDGDSHALNYIMDKYSELVNMKASKFFIIGAEKGDIVQEGLIGLYKATKAFDLEKQNSFKTFANMCIERQIITAIKTANRQKNIPLNSAFSINAQLYDENDENDKEVVDILNAHCVEDPSDSIAKREYFEIINKTINENLSEHERNVLRYYEQNKSYAEIAEKLNCKTKSVDTAMTRIRRKANKIKKEVEEKEES